MIYSDNQKTLKQEDDFQNYVTIINSTISKGNSICTVKTDQFHFIRDLISVKFYLLRITIKYTEVWTVFLFQSFLVITVVSVKKKYNKKRRKICVIMIKYTWKSLTIFGWSRVFIILTSLNSFCKLPGFSWVLSMILIATSLPVGICFASLT